MKHPPISIHLLSSTHKTSYCEHTADSYVAIKVSLRYIVFVSLCCRRASLLSTSTSELPDSLGPADTRFLNQSVWNLGGQALALLADSVEAAEFESTPRRNRYATLLAVTISVFACRNFWTA